MKKANCIMSPGKRKTFAQLFWKKWLWIMGACVLFGGLGLAVFTTLVKNSQINDFYDQEYMRISGIEKLDEGNLTVMAGNQMLKGAIMAEAHKIASALYESDTKELIAGCEEQIFVLKSRSEESSPRVYSFPTERIPGWEEHRAKLAEKRKSAAVYTETINMPYFYTDGENIIPGPFSVEVTAINLFDFEMATDVYEPKSLFVSNFEVPQPIPEGYVKQEVGQKPFVFQPLVVGYHKSNPWIYRNPCMNDSYQILMDTYEEAKATGKVTERLDETAFTLTMVSCIERVLEDGRMVTLLSCKHYDVIRVWWKLIGIIIMVVLVLGSLLALILTKLSYAGWKARYAMEDYRKNLMNTMAHDLKSPLMSISGYAENLESHMNPDKQEHYGKAIQENVQYMNSIIESILALSKIEQGGARLNRTKMDVASVIEECLGKYELQLKKKELTFEVTGKLVLQADCAFMTQALDNLIGNAVKYSVPGGVIQVVLKENEAEIINTCKDDLTGVMDALCEPFVVGDESRSDKTGSGLGLAIVKSICDLHGFAFEVRYDEGKFRAVIKVR